MFERLPTPWGLVRLGRRARPSEDQVGLAGLREDRRSGPASASSATSRSAATSRTTTCCGSTTPSSTRSARRPTGAWASRARTCPARGPRPSSSPGTTATPTSRASRSTSPGRRAVVVGNGNVAVDVARMLALTEEELAATDTADEAIAAILGSGIEEILVLGRRGPAQAAFTTPELIELGELAGADVVVDPADLELDPASAAALEDDTAIARRNVEVLREFVGDAPRPGGRSGCACASAPRRSRSWATERVEAVEVVRNELVADAGGRIRAVPTEEREVIPCGIVLRSVGYRGTAHAGRPLRRGARDDPQRRRPRPRRRRHAAAGRLLQRLDQARPERRDRHEQEGRDRDRRAAPRGRGRRPAAAAHGDAETSRSSSPRGASTRSPTPAGRRSTRPSAREARSRAGPG